MSMLLRTLSTSMLLLVCASALAACGSEGRDDDGGDTTRSKPAVVSADDLDLGVFEARGVKAIPSARAGGAADGVALDRGQEIEAGRIAEVLVDPADVDDDFNELGRPIGSAASVKAFTNVITFDDRQLYTLRNSSSTVRRYDGARDMDATMTLSTFDTPAIASDFARRAGGELSRDGKPTSGGIQRRASPISIDGQPGAVAGVGSFDKDDPAPSVTAVLAIGSTAIIANVATDTAGRREAQVELVGELLAAQAERLDGFEPTLRADLPDLEVEHADVAALTLTVPAAAAKDAAVPDDGLLIPVLGPIGALHQQTYAGTTAEAFRRADVDAVALGLSSVYRAGDRDKATRLVEDLAKNATDEQYEEVASPEGLDDAKCFHAVDDEAFLSEFFCNVAVGRYVGEAGGTSLDQAQAATSAQYLVLSTAQ